MTATPISPEASTTAEHLQVLADVHTLAGIAVKRRRILDAVACHGCLRDDDLAAVLNEKVAVLEESADYILSEIEYTLDRLRGAAMIYPSSGTRSGLEVPRSGEGLLLAGRQGGDLVLVARDRRTMVMSPSPDRSEVTVRRMDLSDYDDVVEETIPLRQALQERDFFSEG